MRSILLALLSASLVAAWPWDHNPECDAAPLIDPLGYYALGYQTRCGLLNDGTCTCEVRSCCDENRRQELLAMCRQSAPFCTPNESGNVEDHLQSETTATPQPHLAHAGSGVGLAAAFGLAAVALAGVVVANSRRGATPDQAPEAPML